MIEKLVYDKDTKMFVDPEGTSWESKSDYLYTGVLPLCGCGDPSSIGRYVKDMLLKHVKQTDCDDNSCWDITHYEDLPVCYVLFVLGK